MSSFATTVVQDQKNIILAEDKKMLQALQSRAEYEEQEE
jgi:hypothetical protein